MLGPFCIPCIESGLDVRMLPQPAESGFLYRCSQCGYEGDRGSWLSLEELRLKAERDETLHEERRLNLVHFGPSGIPVGSELEVRNRRRQTR